MAKLYRRSDSKYWWVSFGGKRKSTKTTSKKDAQILADGWGRAQRLADRKRLIPARAQEVVSEIMCDAGLGEELTLSQALERWLSTSEASLETIGRYRKQVGTFVTPRADRLLALVRIEDVQEHVAHLRAQGYSESSVKLYVAHLRLFLGYWVDMGHLTANPAKLVKIRKAPQEIREVFTRDEVETLLAMADDNWRGMIMLGYYLGARLGDCSNMTWDSIDFDRCSVTFAPQKTANKTGKIEVPLHSRLRDYLLSLDPGDDPAGAILPEMRGHIRPGTNGLSNQFLKLMRLAGVDNMPGQAKTGKGRQISKRSFHSLRHSMISHMAEAGVAMEVRQKIAGHTTRASHQRYTHLELEKLRSSGIEKL